MQAAAHQQSTASAKDPVSITWLPLVIVSGFFRVHEGIEMNTPTKRRRRSATRSGKSETAFSVERAAQLLNVDPRSLHKAIDLRVLDAETFGGVRIIARNVLGAFAITCGLRTSWY